MKEYLQNHTALTISCLTYYECFRGYHVLEATKKLQAFQEILAYINVIYLDQSILDKTAEVYAHLYKLGQLPGELDLLIGCTALVNDWKMVTNNEKHYRALSSHFGLRVENWLK